MENSLIKFFPSFFRDFFCRSMIANQINFSFYCDIVFIFEIKFTHMRKRERVRERQKKNKYRCGTIIWCEKCACNQIGFRNTIFFFCFNIFMHLTRACTSSKQFTNLIIQWNAKIQLKIPWVATAKKNIDRMLLLYGVPAQMNQFNSSPFFHRRLFFLFVYPFDCDANRATKNEQMSLEVCIVHMFPLFDHLLFSTLCGNGLPSHFIRIVCFQYSQQRNDT